MTLPDLALIHGWGLGSAVWEPILEPLAEHARLHLIDLPGYGNTPEKHDTGTDFEQTARSIAAALPDGTALCGWSLGGLLAMQAALLAPSRVGKLILVGATPSFTQRDGWPDAQPAGLLDAFSQALAGGDARAALQRFVALLNRGDAQARPIGREIVRRTLSGDLPRTASLSAGLGWLGTVDLRARIDAIDIPVLLIHGECDPLMPLPAARRLAGRLPQARLEIFPDAAHAPFYSAPERFVRLIGDFVHAPARH